MGDALVTEAELKRAVLEIAREYGWMVYHVPARKILNGGGAGYPDLTLARDRRAVWIELKQEDGQMSQGQMRWMLELPHVHVIRPSDLDSLRMILA